MKFCTDICGRQRIDRTEFDDSLTFPPIPTLSLTIVVFSEISQGLLEGMKFGV